MYLRIKILLIKLPKEAMKALGITNQPSLEFLLGEFLFVIMEKMAEIQPPVTIYSIF